MASVIMSIVTARRPRGTPILRTGDGFQFFLFLVEYRHGEIVTGSPGMAGIIARRAVQIVYRHVKAFSNYGIGILAAEGNVRALPLLGFEC